MPCKLTSRPPSSLTALFARLLRLQSEVTATVLFDTLALPQKEKYAHDPHP